MADFKYSIGDMVVYVHCGESYNKYAEMAEHMGLLDSWQVSGNTVIPEGSVGRVIARSQHLNPDDKALVYMVSFDGVLKLITERGITLNTNIKPLLKTGMLVIDGRGKVGMVLLDTKDGDIISGEFCCSLGSFSDNLERKVHEGFDCNIMEVRQPRYNENYLCRSGGLTKAYSVADKVWKRPNRLIEFEGKEYTKSELLELNMRLARIVSGLDK